MDAPEAEHRHALERANASVAAAAAKAGADPRRPRYHVTSPAYWINDPNGPIYHAGEYHLFFQHNPFASEWGNPCWGHVVSEDLVHWRHLPIALAPGPGAYDRQGIFSGCCVVHDGVPTVLYTGVSPECQCIATGDDRLRSFTKHPDNPVIPTPPRGDLDGFRDPYCWKEGDSWYLVVGSRIRGEGGCVLLYRSADLQSWTYLGPLYAGGSDVMECPNFFRLGEKWLLCASPLGRVVYAIGEFTDHRFRPETGWLAMDLGGREDFYAPNSMLDRQGRRIQWAWVPVGSPAADWNGVLTLPRVLSLRTDGRLGIEPLPELARLRVRPQEFGGVPLDEQAPRVLGDLPSDTVEIRLDLELETACEVGITLTGVPYGRKQTTVSYHHRNGRFSCGSRSGSFRLLEEEERLELRIFLDRSVLEVYANGRVALTDHSRRTELDSGSRDSGPRRTFALFARGGAARALGIRVWEMASIWGR